LAVGKIGVLIIQLAFVVTLEYHIAAHEYGHYRVGDLVD
jgi:hypothetical protein